MSQRIHEIEAPGGPFRLRPAVAGDAAFQAELFRARRAPALHLAGAPASMVEKLLEMQSSARNQSYRQAFPDALWLIAERSGEPVGELIVDDRGEGAHIVDMTLSPAHQGRGFGAALVAWVMSAGGARGVSALADVGNVRSRAMFARLGFVESACADGAHVELVWRP